MSGITEAVTQVLGTALGIVAVAGTRFLERKYGKVIEGEDTNE